MPIVRKRHIKGINLDPVDLTLEPLNKEGDLALDSSDGSLNYRKIENTTIEVNENSADNTLDFDNSNSIVKVGDIVEYAAQDYLVTTATTTGISLDNLTITTDTTVNIIQKESTKTLLDSTGSQVLSNKTLDTSSTIKYENLAIGAAIDPLQKGMTDVDNVADALDAIRVLIEEQNEASEIDYTIKIGTGDNWDSFIDEEITTVDLALDELASRVTANEGSITSDQQALQDHLNNTTGAHAASAISYDASTSGIQKEDPLNPGSFINVDQVQDALDSLKENVDTRALADMGTITNASIETPSRLDVKQSTEADLVDYAAGTGIYSGDGPASNGQIVFATDNKKMFQVLDGALEPIGGGGGATQFEVNQSTHDFSLGDGIYHDSVSDSWVKAQADDADTLATYVVIQVVDENNFVAADFGRIEATAHGFTVGEFYYLSETVAGQPTTTLPTIFSNPLFYVESTNVLQVKVYRPEEVEAVDTISILAAEDVSANDALYVNAIGTVGPLNADDDLKIEFIGFAKNAATAGNPVEIITSGKLAGFTGLTPADFVYADPTMPGKLVQTEPTADNVYIVIAGKAISATEILINPDLGATTEFNAAVVDDITIANNQIVAQSLTGVAFDSTEHRAVILSYSILRSIDGIESSQVGQLRLAYRASSWSLSDDFSGDDAGVTFTITSAGQVQYTSTNLVGTIYSGSLKVIVSEYLPYRN